MSSSRHDHCFIAMEILWSRHTKPLGHFARSTVHISKRMKKIYLNMSLEKLVVICFVYTFRVLFDAVTSEVRQLHSGVRKLRTQLERAGEDLKVQFVRFVQVTLPLCRLSWHFHSSFK